MWVTEQRMEWLETRRRKDEFRRNIRDHSILSAQKQKLARERRIERAQQKREATARALQAIRSKRERKDNEDLDDVKPKAKKGRKESSTTKPAKKAKVARGKAYSQVDTVSHKLSEYCFTPIVRAPSSSSQAVSTLSKATNVAVSRAKPISTSSRSNHSSFSRSTPSSFATHGVAKKTTPSSHAHDDDDASTASRHHICFDGIWPFALFFFAFLSRMKAIGNTVGLKWDCLTFLNLL